MGHGVKKGELTGVFKKRMSELRARAKNWSDSFRFGGAKHWYTPDGLKEPLDVPSLSVPAWERNEINQKYSVDICGNPNAPGTVGDLVAMKWQADFMAVEERAFRTRHASLPRAMAVMHGRLQGHSNPTGGIYKQLELAIERALSDGSKTG